MMHGEPPSPTAPAPRTVGGAAAPTSAGVPPGAVPPARRGWNARPGAAMKTTGWLGLALLLLFSRCPDRLLNPQFYAKDATVFFRGAATGGLCSLAAPSVGYLQLVPRFVAYAGRLLPWEGMPAAYAAAAAACMLYIVWRVYAARLPAAVRVVSSLGLVLVPQNGEIWINLCCLHFAVTALVVVNLLEPAPASPAESWKRGVEMGVAALMCPEILVLAPVILWRAWRNRGDRLAAPMITVALAAAGIQLLVMAAHPRSVDLDLPRTAGTAAAAFSGYCQSFFGGAGDVGTTIRQGFAGLLAPALVLAALADKSNPHRLTACRLLLLSAGLMVLGRIGNIDHFAIWPRPLGTGGRYTYLPFVLSFWALAWLLAGSIHHWREGRRLVVLAAAVPLLLVPLSASRHWAPMTEPDFHWAQQVREARAGRRSHFVVPPGWRFRVPEAK